MANPLDALDWAHFNERLGAYRPVIDRWIFGLALLGAVLVVHLGLQQARGFEAGCVGVAALEPAGADCAAVVASAAGTLLGISNIVWGVLFYVAVAGLSYVALAVSSRRLLAKQVRAGAIGVGFLYSGYLVYYQAVQLDAYCVLCLASAGIVAALVALQAAFFLPKNRFPHSVMSTRTAKRELTLLTYGLALAGLIVAADFMYAGGREATAASSPSEGAPVDTVQVAEGCAYDAEPVDDFAALIGAQDPVRGHAEAPVTIVEYFDPNCPHCKTMHPVMEEAVEAYGDEARFVFKPMPLWQFSVPQIEALYAAAQENKFFEMLEAQYARQQQGGLSMEQLQEIAREIEMDAGTLTTHLQQQTYRGYVLQQRQKAVAAGVDSTPTILVNGRFVDSQSRTLQCLGAFIDDARASSADDAASG